MLDRWSSIVLGQRKTLNIRYPKESCCFDRPMPDFVLRRVSKPMQITIDIPDDIASQLLQNIADLPRRTLESLMVQAYRDALLTPIEVGKILGLDRWQVETFLHQNQAYLHYDELDLEHDRTTLHQLRMEQSQQ